jgi:hypothetical protein
MSELSWRPCGAYIESRVWWHGLKPCPSLNPDELLAARTRSLVAGTSSLLGASAVRSVGGGGAKSRSQGLPPYGSVCGVEW